MYELYNKLADSKMYTKLNLSHACQQIELDEDSKLFTTIITTNGLLYGVNCVSGIFKKVIEQVIHIPFTAVYLDAIVVNGATIIEHKTNLKLLLDRLFKTVLRLKREKCDFMKNSVIFLGPIIESKWKLYPFEWPDAPWYRVHIDHTEIRGNISLVIIIDTQSKHIDTHRVNILIHTSYPRQALIMQLESYDKLYLHMGFQILSVLIMVLHSQVENLSNSVHTMILKVFIHPLFTPRQWIGWVSGTNNQIRIEEDGR